MAMAMAMDVVATNEFTARTPEMECDQTAMGFPPVTSTVFLIANII
jgi:hypothetical protein